MRGSIGGVGRWGPAPEERTPRGVPTPVALRLFRHRTIAFPLRVETADLPRLIGLFHRRAHFFSDLLVVGRGLPFGDVALQLARITGSSILLAPPHVCLPATCFGNEALMPLSTHPRLRVDFFRQQLAPRAIVRLLEIPTTTVKPPIARPSPACPSPPPHFFSSSSFHIG